MYLGHLLTICPHFLFLDSETLSYSPSVFLPYLWVSFS